MSACIGHTPLVRIGYIVAFLSVILEVQGSLDGGCEYVMNEIWIRIGLSPTSEDRIQLDVIMFNVCADNDASEYHHE